MRTRESAILANGMTLGFVTDSLFVCHLCADPNRRSPALTPVAGATTAASVMIGSLPFCSSASDTASNRRTPSHFNVA